MQKRIASGAIAAVLAVFVSAWATAFAQVGVTECGQVIPRGQTGQLVADLNCSGFEGDTVVLDSGGKLLLNGFTLTGYSADPNLGVVRCLRRCKIEGPGTITGGGNGVIGKALPHIPPLRRRVRTNVRIRGTTIADNLGAGVKADRVRIEGCTITDNLGGVVGNRSPKIEQSTISSNDWVGVLSYRRARIRDSVVVDNGLDPECPNESNSGCADIVLGRKPRLVGTTCGTSLNLSQPGFGCFETWGVCAEDPEFGLCEQP